MVIICIFSDIWKRKKSLVVVKMFDALIFVAEMYIVMLYYKAGTALRLDGTKKFLQLSAV